VKKFISDLRQVGDLRRFHPLLTRGVKHHSPNPYVRGTPFWDKIKNMNLSIAYYPSHGWLYISLKSPKEKYIYYIALIAHRVSYIKGF
jgi:hypothetical protein